jgi:hypothetical protein
MVLSFCHTYAGPWQAEIPQQVKAGEEFEMTFRCTNPDVKMCPTYYMVQFRGPTIQVVNPSDFSPLNWTFNAPSEYAYLTAKHVIRDPGDYTVYVYPELYYCSQWNHLEFPWHRGAVQGTPFHIKVTGNAPMEGYGVCTTDEIYDGRYVASGGKYFYEPYSCKIPHRNILDAVAEMPTAKHILWVGDSVTRNPFCQRIWKTLHGSVSGACDGEEESFHFSHKFTEAETGNRTIKFSFLWSPHWHAFERDNRDIALALDPPPTHLVLSFGLYVLFLLLMQVDCERQFRHIAAAHSSGTRIFHRKLPFNRTYRC